MSNLQVNETLSYAPEDKASYENFQRLAQRVNRLAEIVETLRLSESSPSAVLATASTLALRDPSGFIAANGIAFPATQVPSADANTLDDYEEGTWSPTFGGTGSNPTVTYSIQTGRYVKIGKVVLIAGGLAITAKSGGTGSLLIAGFPFTVGAGYGSEGLISGTASFNWGATAAPQIGSPVKSAANMQLFTNDSSDARSGLGTNITTANLTTTAAWVFGGYYLID